MSAGQPVCSDKRRRWCDMPKNLHNRFLDTDHVYTFQIWQHLIDFSTYKLSVGGFVNLDLTHALNCQPLQLTCKDTKVSDSGHLHRDCVMSIGAVVVCRDPSRFAFQHALSVSSGAQ